MKHARKLASLLLALVMVFALATTAFAAEKNGTITIDNPVEGQTYNAYLMFELESYNAETKAYSYKITNDWKEFVTKGAGKDYFSIDAQGYVTLNEGVTDDAAATIAKAAVAYAASKKLSPAATLPKEDGSYIASGLTLGYYVVDSSLGALCGLTTTTPSATISEKNKVPTNVKTAEEDSTGKYGSINDAEIGQTVNFKSTITAQPGAKNYVFEDTMSAGLTYNDDARVYTDEAMTEELAAENYTVNLNPGEGKTFTITFTQNYLDTITAETKLYVKYSATLNKDAVVGLPGNSNKSTLKYGDSANTKSTPASETITYTWDLDVLKYGNNDKTNVLENAQFVLLNKDRDKVAVVVDGKLTGWTDVPAVGENWPANTVLTTNAQGKITISGLDSNTYYLREIKAPAGYNTLKEDVKVVITGATKGEGSKLTYQTVLAEIQNLSGTELPSTGGMGTTIFYVLGSALVLGAVVLLVTKKRMSTKD